MSNHKKIQHHALASCDNSFKRDHVGFEAPQVCHQPSILRILAEKVFEAPGGSAWKNLLGAFPNLDIYLAGGAVRDELMHRQTKVKDFDFFISGSQVHECLDYLKAASPLDRGPFGSPRWYPYHNGTFYYDVILIERFFNGLQHCVTIADALNQFDFTANAVAINLRTGEFFDPQDGKRDIQRRVMRAVRFDYPDEPISAEISLTRPEIVWFRILHYAAALNLTIEPATMAWLEENQIYTRDADQFVEHFFPLHAEWASCLERTMHGR